VLFNQDEKYQAGRRRKDGQAAMMRASGINERWGHLPRETSSLMLWGQAQYRQFTEFLAEIRAEQPIDIFPAGSWKLDQWDGK